MKEPILDLSTEVMSLVNTSRDMWTLSSCGITSSEKTIECLVHRDAYQTDEETFRILLVGGLSGNQQDVQMALKFMHLYRKNSKRIRQCSMSLVPCASPADTHDSGYPPEGGYFDHPTERGKRYLWRWVSYYGPDLVLDLRLSDQVLWQANTAAIDKYQALSPIEISRDASLLSALSEVSRGGLGEIPGIRLSTTEEQLRIQSDQLWEVLHQLTKSPFRSAARKTLESRAAREPVEVSRVLAQVHGHTLDPMMYTKGVAVSGRVRLAELDLTYQNYLDEIEELVSTFVSGFDVLDKKTLAQGALSGFVWCDDLADATGNQSYSDVLVRVADLFKPRGIESGKEPQEADTLVEDMFHAGVLWGRAYKFTGEVSYLDRLANFLVKARNQREDGYFWHSPSTPYYWGRGNGFAALAFAEALTYMPIDYRERDGILAKHIRHLDALKKLQLPSGMFPQLLDSPGSFEEFTSTCQIGYAVTRGLRFEWLEDSYREMMEAAWRGVAQRIDGEGNVTDACEGTGLMPNREAYLDRKAISGFDDRSGSMAIWFATEISRFQSQV